MTSQTAWVRAHIIGVTLSRVSNLGRGYTALQSDMFRIGHPRPTQSVADRIRSHRVQPDPGVTLAQLVDDCFQADRLSPIRLLKALSSSNVVDSPSPPSFPTQVLAGVREWAPTDGDYDVADCHLHSGAAVDLSSLLELLVSSSHHFVELMYDASREDEAASAEARERLQSCWASDYSGDSYFLPVVLGAVRAHLARLVNPSGWSMGKPVCASLFARGHFWSTVGEYARSFTGDDLFFAELSSRFETNQERQPEDIATLLRDQILRAPGFSEAELNEWIGLMAGVCVIHSSLASAPGEGLTRFAARFDRMGVLRGLTAGLAKPRLVEAACHSVFTSQRVKAAEFRKTIVVGDKTIGDLEGAIQSNLVSHVNGAARFARASDRPLRIAMPVGFHRSPDAPYADPDRWVARYRLQAVSRLTEALVNRVSDERDLSREFVTAVDVAGDEAAMPSWPFLVAFQRLQSSDAAHLRRVMHAGESFSWPLQGIRRVGEVMQLEAGVQAIGHALALDPIVADLIVGEYPPDLSLIEVVQDLCWLASEKISEAEALQLLSRIALDCGLRARGIDAEALVAGWRGLRSLSYLREIGICNADLPFEFIEFAHDSMIRNRSPHARAAWALAFVAPGVDHLSGSIEGALRGEFLGLQAKVLVEARARVVGRMRSQGVLVEACPTSNRRLANIPLWKLAHFERFIHDAKLRVSVSSDDPVVFSTNVETEVRTIAAWFSPELAEAMARASLDSCAASDRERTAAELERAASVLAGE